MDLSDIPFVYREEERIFGSSLGEKTLYNEIIYNNMSRYFVALRNKKRIGYIGAWLTEPNAEILNLFVLEKYRGHKVGSRLLQEVLDVCQDSDIENITLEVRPSNIAAIALYKSFGFHEATRRKQYYNDGEDALLMFRTVGEKK
jgi:ribosomal-protein-alanine N-acetyltransferase